MHAASVRPAGVHGRVRIEPVLADVLHACSRQQASPTGLTTVTDKCCCGSRQSSRSPFCNRSELHKKLVCGGPGLQEPVAAVLSMRSLLARTCQVGLRSASR